MMFFLSDKHGQTSNVICIVKNWFLTLQPDNYLQFTKVGTRKDMDVI